LLIIRQRIAEKILQKPEWYKWSPGEKKSGEGESHEEKRL